MTPTRPCTAPSVAGRDRWRYSTPNCSSRRYRRSACTAELPVPSSAGRWRCTTSPWSRSARADHRGGGAAAVGSPGAGAHASGPVHSARGGVGAHHAHRPVGAARGLQGAAAWDRGVAGAGAAQRQPLGAGAGAPGSRRERARDAGGDRLRSRAAAHGDHGVASSSTGPTCPRPVERVRRLGCRCVSTTSAPATRLWDTFTSSRWSSSRSTGCSYAAWGGCGRGGGIVAPSSSWRAALGLDVLAEGVETGSRRTRCATWPVSRPRASTSRSPCARTRSTGWSRASPSAAPASGAAMRWN